MGLQIQRTGNTRGLAYIGRSSFNAQKIQPVQPVSEIIDHKYRYYYNIYLKGEGKMSNMKDFKEVRAENLIIMDIEAQEDMNIPRLARLSKKLLRLDKAVEAIRSAGLELPNRSRQMAAAISDINAMKTDLQAEIEKLSRVESTEEARRTIPIKCNTCGRDNYFSRKEYFIADGTPCTHCKNPL